MHPRKLVRDSLGFAASQFMVRAALIVRTALAARWLGPHAFGAWNALQLLMDYGILAPLGTQQGLDQLVPRRIVDGDPESLARIKRAGITNILVTTLLFCAGWLLYFRGSSGSLMRIWGLGGLALAMLIVVLVNWASYHTGLLRSHGNIRAVSLWFFTQGMIGALLGLALVRVIGVWGLLWGWVAGTAVAFTWTRWEARQIAPVQPTIAAESLALYKVGFPIFFFSGSALILRNLDRLIILRYLGTKDLGYYSLAVTAFTLLMYLPDSATYVLYPRLLQRFHAAGDRPEAVRDSALGVLRVLTTLTPALGALAFLATRDVILVVVPNFLSGAPAVRVMCFAAGALCVSNVASVVLMTLGRQVLLMPVAVLSTATFALADTAALRAGLGITGVAWATFAAYGLTGLALLWLALYALRLGLADTLREAGATMWALGSAMALAFLVDRWMPWSGSPGLEWRVLRVLLGCATFLGVYALAVGPLLRGHGLRQLISEFNLPFMAWLRRENGSGGRAG